MRNKWQQLGCFLTGYNYRLLRECSEESIKRLVRYTSALFIIGILWAFVGYSFSSRYLKSDWYISLLGAVLLVVIVIQIERQIILGSRENRWLFGFRVLIGVVMAVIGSIIIDQILFKDDIEQERLISIEYRVKEVFPVKSSELKKQIFGLDSVVLVKEKERHDLVEDLSKHPTITIYSRQITSEKNDIDSLESKTRETTTRTSSQIENPKYTMLQSVDDQLSKLREDKLVKEENLIDLRSKIEEEFKSKIGFLDELELMISILSRSTVAIFVWILWFVLLMSIELFILASKLFERDTDYDEMLRQQMLIHFKRIALLNRQIQ